MSQKINVSSKIIGGVIVGLTVYLFGIVTSVFNNWIPMERCAAWEGEPFLSNCDAPYYTPFGNLLIWLAVAAFFILPFAVYLLAKNEAKVNKKRKK